MQWDIGKPNPRQIEFFKARARFIAYGGARGGGKSWAVRKKAAGLALSYPGAGILIVRRTFPELRENHILPMTADLAGVARYRDADKSFTFPGGSRIVFGYCSSESDVLQYQGQEYDVIFMDEATQFTEFQFTTLTACLRGANDFPKRFYLTCNPGGVGHAWVKRLFIDRRYKKAEHPEDYVFIAANVYDNHALMAHDPDYVRMLENLPEEQRRAWLLGQWDIFEGQYFAEFDRNVHVCRPHGIPAHWRRYVTLDYGMDMLAALWVAVDEQGRAVVYRELYEGRDNGKGENGQGHIISAAARRRRPGWLRRTCGTAGRTREKARRSCFWRTACRLQRRATAVWPDGWRCGNFWRRGRADRRGVAKPRGRKPATACAGFACKTELKTRRRGVAKPRKRSACERPARLCRGCASSTPAQT